VVLCRHLRNLLWKVIGILDNADVILAKKGLKRHKGKDKKA